MEIKRTVWLTGSIWLIALTFVPLVFGEQSDLLQQYYGFHPYITLSETWDDNINLTQDNRISDFITTISPGFIYRSKGAGYDFDLGYELGFNSYASHSDNNYVGQDGHLRGFYDIDQLWTVRLNEALTYTREGIGTYTTTSPTGPIVTSSANPYSTLYWRNIFEPAVEYKFGREDLFSFQYRNNIYRPDNNNYGYGNSTENAFSPHLAYWFDIRNGITLDYTYSTGTFEDYPNYVGNFIAGRYIYRFNPRTKIYGNFSYELKDFDSPGINYSVYSPTVGLEHAFTATLIGRAEAGGFWTVVDTGPSLSGPVYNFSITQTGPRTTYALAIQGGYREQYFTTENLGFSKYNQIVASVTHKLMERLSLGFSGILARDEYQFPSRTDDSWALTGKLSYQPLKWLTVSLEASNNARDSDLNGDSFRENRGILRLTAVY